MTKIKTNDTVAIHYTGKLENGDVFDSSANAEPLEFKVGEGKVIPGFEKEVIGMEVNETKSFTIPTEEAYGDRRDDLIQKVEKSMLPEDLKPELGMTLMSESPEGHQMMLKVTEIDDETITVDANHPLAGKDLSFDITVIDIKG
ncbi:MAG: peptidylprolyl isomerase [Bacteroidales bacterium]|nr:peptidylprolyl isomerase [Bacteroidales bacterium]